MSPTFIQTTFILFSYLLFSASPARGALIPVLPLQTDITGQPSLFTQLSGPVAFPTTTVNELASQATGLNPLSLANTPSLLPTSYASSALKNVFNGVNVALPSSPNTPIGPTIANLASSSNQILQTASGLLQGAIVNTLPSVFPTPLPLVSPSSTLQNAIIQNLQPSCVEIFTVASLAFGSGPSTLITLQPACSPLSVFIDDVKATATTSVSALVSISSAAQDAVLKTFVPAGTASSVLSSASLSSPNPGVATSVSQLTVNPPSIAVAPTSLSYTGSASSSLPPDSAQSVNSMGNIVLSSFDGTAQCERSSPATTTIYALSTTISNQVAPTSLSALLPATIVSSTVPTCTNSIPGSPQVTCTGGPDFSTLFCPRGCPTIFTSQCAFFCMSNVGNRITGLFAAVQCAPIDLSLISPGTLSCEQCYPQCNNGSLTASPGLLSGASNITASSSSTINVTSSNNDTLPTVTLPASSISTLSPICTIASPGALDTPASQDIASGILFRSSCGISAATVAQCPFLCSQGGAAFFQECSNTDISGKQPVGQFPPIQCTHCLPPCSNTSASSIAMPLSGLVQLTTGAGGSGVGNSTTAALFPTASVTAPFPNELTSALPSIMLGSSNQSISGSILVSSISPPFPSAISRTESGQANLSTSTEALAALSDLASSVINTSVSIALISSSASLSAKVTNSNTGSISTTIFGLASLTIVSITSAISTSAGSTQNSLSSPTCATMIPSGTDIPAIVEPNTGLLVRSSCGFTAKTVAQCPFICSAGGGAPNGNCSAEDMTGRLMYGTYPPIVCHQCLPPCEAVTTTSAGPTCSSITPNSPDPSPLIDLSGLLHRDSCGTSASSVAECPYLCGLRDQGVISRQCFYQDLTNKTIDGQAADVGLLTCEKCLPPCGNSALTTCRYSVLSDVRSVVGALPGAIPGTISGLIGSVQVQPFIGAIPSSILAVPGSIQAQSIIAGITTNIPTIIGAVPTPILSLAGSIKSNPIGALPVTVASMIGGIPSSVLTAADLNEAQSIIRGLTATAPDIIEGIHTILPVLANTIGVQSIPSALPVTSQILAGSIEAQVPSNAAIHTVLSSIIAIPPNLAAPVAVQHVSTATLPTNVATAASLPIAAIPSSLTVPLQGGSIFHPFEEKRDLAYAFGRRDVVNTIVEGSPAAQLQLSCGDTSEAVAACPFLCSPMNGGMQGFRRCAAVDLTNNFIGVNRVTCEKCLPLCLN